MCVAGGIAGGAIVGTRAVKVQKSRDAYLIAAGTIMGLSGMLGCAVLGVSGALGFMVGAVAVSTPIVLVGHYRFAG